MANRKNYGDSRTERLCVRLSKKDKQRLVTISWLYKLDTSSMIRLMIRSYAEYFSGDAQGYIKGGMTDADI